MPELKMPRNDFIDAVRKKAKLRDRFLFKDEVEELAKKYNQEVVGDGAECVVIPGEKDKVAAFTYHDMDPFNAKITFYTQRILSTLFPNNFPHFYAAFWKNKDPNQPLGTLRHRIYKSEATIKYPIKEVREISQILGLDFNLDTETPDNFMIGGDGGEYYLDKTYIKRPSLINIRKIKTYMLEEKFSTTDMNIVLQSIQRLLEIIKEERQKKTKNDLYSL